MMGCDGLSAGSASLELLFVLASAGVLFHLVSQSLCTALRMSIPPCHSAAQTIRLSRGSINNLVRNVCRWPGRPYTLTGS